MPRIPSVLPALVLVTLVAACSSDPTRPPVAAPTAAADNPLLRRNGVFWQGWAMDRLWEDGQAEVAVYDAERVLDSELRRFEYTIITVKEEFNQQFNVRTTDGQRPDLFPVMKVNQLCQIPARDYPQHLLTSLFFRRDQPVQLHKLTTSSQDGVGTMFKAITDEGLHYAQTYNSYHDGEGTGQRLLPLNALFEDALPYTLRALRFEQQPRFVARIYELQQTIRASKAARPDAFEARIGVEAAAPADTPEPAWRVRVQLSLSKANTYWFAKAYPNVLLRQNTWDDRNLRLRQVRRVAYQQ